MIIIIDTLAIAQAKLRSELLRDREGYIPLRLMKEPAEIIRDWATKKWNINQLYLWDEKTEKDFNKLISETDSSDIKNWMFISYIAGLVKSELIKYGDVPIDFQPVLDAETLWIQNCDESGYDQRYAANNFSGVIAFAITGLPQLEQ